MTDDAAAHEPPLGIVALLTDAQPECPATGGGPATGGAGATEAVAVVVAPVGPVSTHGALWGKPEANGVGTQ